LLLGSEAAIGRKDSRWGGARTAPPGIVEREEARPVKFDDMPHDTTVEEDGGPLGARLASSGVSIWALVLYYQAVGGDPERGARDYDLSQAAVKAALAYYRPDQAAIDARIAEHRAAVALTG
jgi:uncharacterized protein (DUF433 family)